VTNVTKPKSMKTFFVIWLGQLLSMVGSGLTGFALGVWIFEQTGQATPFAMTALFGILPRLILSPFAGALVDRWNRKTVMIISDSAAGVVTLIAAALLMSGNLEVWMIYIISALEAIFGTFQEPAYMSSVSLLVPKEQLGRANGMIGLGQSIEAIITPIIAGALFVGIGLQGVIIIDIVTLVFAVLALVIVRIPQPEIAQVSDVSEKKKSIWGDIAFGWQYLTKRQGLLGLLLYFACVNFFLNVCGITLGPLILSSGTPTQLGLVQTAMGLGMLGGSLVISTWGGPKRNRVPMVIGVISLASVGYILIGVSSDIIYTLLGGFTLMLFIPVASGISQTMFQVKVVPNVQGRVFATRGMISRSMMPIAFLISGPVADYVFKPLLIEGGVLANTFVGRWIGVGPGRGLGLMFIATGICVMLISLAAYAYPRIRRLEKEIPDVIEAGVNDQKVVEKDVRREIPRKVEA